MSSLEDLPSTSQMYFAHRIVPPPDCGIIATIVSSIRGKKVNRTSCRLLVALSKTWKRRWKPSTELIKLLCNIFSPHLKKNCNIQQKSEVHAYQSNLDIKCKSLDHFLATRNASSHTALRYMPEYIIYFLFIYDTMAVIRDLFMAIKDLKRLLREWEVQVRAPIITIACRCSIWFSSEDEMFKFIFEL